MAQTQKTLILLRHGHRDRIPDEHDNGLSQKGWLQAADAANSLFQKWEKTWDQSKVDLLTSPKLRCQETIEPFSKMIKGEITMEPLLVEAKAAETHAEFVERIQKFINMWKKSSAPVTVACSHSDWIPIALQLLVNEVGSVSKGAYYEIVFKNGALSLESYREPKTS